MALSIDTVRETCKLGKGAECCRYLSMGGTGFQCEKLGPIRGIIDSRMNNGTMQAQGDNCPGEMRE